MYIVTSSIYINYKKNNLNNNLQSILIMEELNSNENSEEIRVFNNWDDYELKDDLLRGIYSYGFESPSQIQKTGISPILEKRDVIAQAPSGTGKTGTFTIAALQTIDTSISRTQVLVLAPTHELVNQITNVVTRIGTMMDGLKIKSLVGGTSVMGDSDDLKNNVPHIIIGSVGRVNDMIRRKYIKTQDIKLFILDEADEMLSGGFIDDIHKIFTSFNTDIQVAVFSATLSDEIVDLTNKFMRNPVKLTIEAEKLNLEGISQYYIALRSDQDKYETLKDLFGKLSINQTIIYANSVTRVVDLHQAMVKDGCSCCCIHSSMTSAQRHEALQSFKTGAYRVLISSNVTARGIDVQQVSIVINFDIPRCVHNYLHRIGRSGRWGRKGAAINFVTQEDIANMKRIESHYKSTITELTENFESGLN
jgi:translation initiation factor 4A